MMIMLAAREVGIPPMQALNGGLNIIQGKVEISARMMNALIRKAGHKIDIKDSTDLSCTLVGTRCDNGDRATVSYGLIDAQKAGLVKSGGGWTKCPKDMCFARAMSRLARQLFSDVIGIGYVEGEIKPVDHVEDITEIQEEMPQEINPEDELAALKARYLALFDEADHNKAWEYLNVIMMHFKWDTIDAIKQVIKDPKKLIEKFQSWKSKISTEKADETN